MRKTCAIEMVCFTRRGEELGERLRGEFSARGGDDVTVGLTRCGAARRAGDWTAEHFRTGNALVFIGAAGIAVRAIAPHLVSKASDPAVVVVDDAGRYAVPILSGHLGGANALARRIASLLGAEAVMTTATDRNSVFAIDEWAAQAGYAIANPGAIKTVSSALLEGREVACRCDFPVIGNFPGGLAAGDAAPGIVIGVFRPAGGDALWIVPPAVVLGVGCRRGTPFARLETAWARFSRESGLSPLAVCGVCSIDLKRGEPGLLEFCREHGWALETFSAERLNAVPGDFSSSPFVQAVAGVGSVAERAAVAGTGGGTLCVGGSADGGVVMAAAAKAVSIDFARDGEI